MDFALDPAIALRFLTVLFAWGVVEFVIRVDPID